MRWLVVVVFLEGCGFSLHLGDNTPADAQPDGTIAIDGEMVDAQTCPAFYRSIGIGLYLVLEPTTFKNHHAACNSHGTHLAVIDNQQEIDDLVAFGRTVAGVNSNSRFYIGLVQAPAQLEPEDNWIDFQDRNSDNDLWAQSGNNEPNDGADDSESNHQEQVAAIQLDRDAIIDLASTENVRAYCECDGMPVGPKAAMYVAAPDL
jgi:hypothetical protein